MQTSSSFHIAVILILSVLLFSSCKEGSPNYDEFHYDEVSGVTKEIGCPILHCFNGERLGFDSVPEGFAVCRQQQFGDTKAYYAVFPEENYVGLQDGELVIRLFQHQRRYPAYETYRSAPAVAFGWIKHQKLTRVNGGVRVLLKGKAKVTALRFTDNDTLNMLWGNFVVHHPGKDNQQLEALAHSEGGNVVWIDCREGVQLSPDTATEFDVMLPPGAFHRGFSMDVFSGDSIVFQITSQKPKHIRPGKLQKMPAIDISAKSHLK